MMFKVFLNNLFCQLTRGYAKVPTSPKVLTPILFFQMRELLKYFSGYPAFYASHYVRRGNIGRCRHQDMNMVLADNATYDMDLEPFTSLADKFSDPQSNIPFQHMISIFGKPNEMILNLKFCMTVLPIAHSKNYKTTTGKMLPA